MEPKVWRGRCLLITNPAGREQVSAGTKPRPLCHPAGHRAQHTQPTSHEGHPDLHSPGGGEEEQLQQFDGVGGPRVACHGVLDGDRSLHGSQVTPNSALSCGCCCHLAARRANAVQVHKPACSGKALELAQPCSSLTTAHPGLQSRCSKPWYLGAGHCVSTWEPDGWGGLLAKSSQCPD